MRRILIQRKQQMKMIRHYDVMMNMGIRKNRFQASNLLFHAIAIR